MKYRENEAGAVVPIPYRSLTVKNPFGGKESNMIVPFCFISHPINPSVADNILGTNAPNTEWVGHVDAAA
jgi:hypothetical protein